MSRFSKTFLTDASILKVVEACEVQISNENDYNAITTLHTMYHEKTIGAFYSSMAHKDLTVECGFGVEPHQRENLFEISEGGQVHLFDPYIVPSHLANKCLDFTWMDILYMASESKKNDTIPCCLIITSKKYKEQIIYFTHEDCRNVAAALWGK